MNVHKAIYGILLDRKMRFYYLNKVGFYRGLSDEEFIKRKYYLEFGEEINLDNPQTFNEKMQWLKIHDRREIYRILVDKYDVKEYVREKIGEKYIIPTLGVWDHFDDIQFDNLPNAFVLKCTHDSGGVSICKDKNTYDYRREAKYLRKSLRRNYYETGREWPYKHIAPRIIAEQYIENENNELTDYKVHCFNGKAKFVLVCSGRYSEEGLREDFYSVGWERLPIRRVSHPNSSALIPKPNNFEEMINLAEKLSSEFPFLRVDFYNINGIILFGELTLYPASGFAKFIPESWDFKFGEELKLNHI